MRDNLNPKKCFPEDSELQEPATDVILIMMEIGITYKARPQPSERFDESTEEAQDGKAQDGKAQDAMALLQDVDPKGSLESEVQPTAAFAKVEPKDAWKQWVYSVRGVSSQSYPFLQGKESLRKELALLAKCSLNLESWMNDDEVLNKRNFPSPPGLEGRKEHIFKIVPPIAFNSED